MISALLYFLGRAIFGGYFLMNAYNHLFKSGPMIAYAGSKGIPSPRLAVLGSGVLLLIGGLSYFAGAYMYYGTIALLIFLIPVTFKMHAYWDETDPGRQVVQRINFYKNLALIGSLLMMF